MALIAKRWVRRLGLPVASCESERPSPSLDLHSRPRSRTESEPNAPSLHPHRCSCSVRWYSELRSGFRLVEIPAASGLKIASLNRFAIAPTNDRSCQRLGSRDTQPVCFDMVVL